MTENNDTKTLTVEDRVDQVLEGVTTISPYKLAGLASLLNNKYVREQMVYSYVKKNMIPSVRVEGKLQVKVEDARTWLVKYTTKHSWST